MSLIINSNNSNLAIPPNKPEVPPAQSPLFHEMTRRVDPEEMAAINEILRTLPDKEAHMQDLRQALDDHNWNHHIFSNPHFPHYALEALDLELAHPSRLTRGEFCLILRYWKARQDFKPAEIEAIPLFNEDGSVNKAARAMIKETMHMFGGSFQICASLFDGQLQSELGQAMQREDMPEVERIDAEMKQKIESVMIFSEEQIDELFKRMRAYPKSLQQFFKVPDPEGEYCPTGWEEGLEIALGTAGYDHTIDQEINFRTGLNFFSRLMEGGKLIAPPTLMQNFLHIKFGSDATDIIPVLGLSSTDDIESNGSTRERDCAFHFPGVTMPDTADGFPAPNSSFPDHDYYHNYLVSSVPEVVTELYMKIVAHIDSFNHPLRDDKEGIDKLKDRFIDLELPAFRHEFRSRHSVNDLFWAHVYAAFTFLAQRAVKIEENSRMQIAQLIARELPILPEIAAGPRSIYLQSVKTSEDALRTLNEGKQKAVDYLSHAVLEVHIAMHEANKKHPLLKAMTEIWEKRLGHAPAKP